MKMVVQSKLLSVVSVVPLLLERWLVTIEKNYEDRMPPHITPPPTLIYRMLECVSIRVSIPRYIMRGLVRVAYYILKSSLVLLMKTGQSIDVIVDLQNSACNLEWTTQLLCVRLRRAQSLVYLKVMLVILSSVQSCLISINIEHLFTKHDASQFHSFFEQGIDEYTKCDTK